jgi:hypothetical protein
MIVRYLLAKFTIIAFMNIDTILPTQIRLIAKD